MVQKLRLHTPNQKGPGSIIPDQGTRSYRLELRSGTAKQINIKNKKIQKRKKLKKKKKKFKKISQKVRITEL